MTAGACRPRWTGQPTPGEALAWLIDAAVAAGLAHNTLRRPDRAVDRDGLADLLGELWTLLAESSGRLQALQDLLGDRLAREAVNRARFYPEVHR